jgi:predicted CxxxxCH...CXXCH cytochrome family protein
MTHLYNSRWSAQLECEECHVFNGFDDPAHIGANPDGVAEITFGPLANNILQGDTTSVPNPAWNRITASCSNVYCHGTFRMGNKTAAGNWIYPPSVVCGSCHGNPLTGNPTPRDSNGVFHDPHPIELQVTSCYICHGSVINGSGTIFNKDLHVNGAVNY